MKALLCCITIAITLALTACTDSPVDGRLDLADSLMESRPDSALTILDSISAADLRGDAQKARHALLLSMALDKNYVDTTTFDVLQPAIDYYPRHGSPDEKLRTYYYQGRIYQNRSEYNDAMLRYMEACDLRDKITDSLTLARTLVAQGGLYREEYKPELLLKNNLDAAELFQAYGMKMQRFRCFLRALEGCILMENKLAADSVLALCISSSNDIDNGEELLAPIYLSYIADFGTRNEIKKFLGQYQSLPSTKNNHLSMAYALAMAGEYDEASEFLSKADLKGSVIDSLSHKSLQGYIYENQNRYQDALNAYKEFYVIHDRYMYKVVSYDIFFADKRHQLEVDRLNAVSHRDRIILGVACILSLVIVIACVIYYRYRLAISERIIAEKENNNLRLQQFALRREMETLESERDNLKGLLAHSHELDRPIQEIIKQRLDMLNGLLAREIANNTNYAKQYNQWIENLCQDKTRFMDSTRLALTASHPNFIRHLQEHGLTEYELNYACLYAIGLSGKEVGEYIQLKRHYNISTEIRKKLGLEGQKGTISQYIRRLMTELDN